MAPREVRVELEALRASSRLRRFRAVEGAQGRELSVDGRRVVNLSSNNYLGLADDPVLARAAAEGTRRWGSGSGGSRLVVGNLRPHRELEDALAEHWGSGAALVFNSGYQANIGVLQALVGRGDVLFSDELNHASVIDGCRLSRAKVVVYPHRDVEALKRLVDENPGDRRVIVSDSLFSMDGTLAPVAELAAVARDIGAMLMLDEAHAIGVLGPEGRGVAAQAGVAADVVTGTFGKALGSFGAFAIACPDVVTLLLNRARSFVFSTALPPAVVCASRAALAIAAGDRGETLRAALRRNRDRLVAGLREAGISTRCAAGDETQIIPVVVGGEEETMACCEELLAMGYYAQGIRPPTVPPGTSRLRLALMASHTADDIDGFLQALATLVERGMVPTSRAARAGSQEAKK